MFLPQLLVQIMESVAIRSGVLHAVVGLVRPQHARSRSNGRTVLGKGTLNGAPFPLEFLVKEGHDFSRYDLAGL